MDYIEDIPGGLIESYCLGLLDKEENEAFEKLVQLHAGLKKSVNDFMRSVENHALANAVDPGEATRKKILGLLHNLSLEQSGNLENLPLLNKYSDHRQWMKLVKPLLPVKLEGDSFYHELCSDRHLTQMLLWQKVDYPNEVHTKVLESFLILEGRCICHIGEEEIALGPGGYLEIPLYTNHNVRVLETVMAIVQRVKVA